MTNTPAVPPDHCPRCKLPANWDSYHSEILYVCYNVFPMYPQQCFWAVPYLTPDSTDYEMCLKYVHDLKMAVGLPDELPT